DKGNLVLTGNLKEIKRDYGKRRFTLKLKDKTPEETKHILMEQSNLISDIEVQKDNSIIELNIGITSNAFLNELINLDLIVESYSVYEPSLSDIFIHKV